MGITLVARNIYREGDFKVEVFVEQPEALQKEVEALVQKVEGIIDLRRTYAKFKRYGFGVKYYDRISNVIPPTILDFIQIDDYLPVEVCIYKSSPTIAYIDFTYIDDKGHKKLLEIAKVLGIDL